MILAVEDFDDYQCDGQDDDDRHDREDEEDEEVKEDEEDEEDMEEYVGPGRQVWDRTDLLTHFRDKEFLRHFR